MKKTYQTPSISRIQLAASSMLLSGSDLRQNGDNIEGSLYDSDSQTSGLTKSSASSYNVWGDDWSK